MNHYLPDKKRKFIIISLIVFIVLAIFSITIAANIENVGVIVGKIFNKHIKEQDIVVAYVNDEPIYESAVKINIELKALKGFEAEYDSVLEELICNKLLYQSALGSGITIPKEDVDKNIELNKASYNKNLSKKDSDPKAKEMVEIIDGYCKEMGITIDEYWEQNRQAYEGSAMVSQYITSIYQQKNNEDANAFDGQALSVKVYNQIKQEIIVELRESAKIEILKK